MFCFLSACYVIKLVLLPPGLLLSRFAATKNCFVIGLYTFIGWASIFVLCSRAYTIKIELLVFSSASICLFRSICFLEEWGPSHRSWFFDYSRSWFKFFYSLRLPVVLIPFLYIIWSFSFFKTFEKQLKENR